MKTSLEHLPQHKQEHIRNIAEVIVKRIDPEKVILFGSHATGRWVEDRTEQNGTIYEYISDYDILVVTRAGDRRKDHEIESYVEHAFSIEAPINLITHDLDFVNSKLEESHYFFSDIVKEGVMLYDAGNVPLAVARELNQLELKEKLQEHYDIWYNSALRFIVHGEIELREGDPKVGDFLLHQAAERLYTTVMLVFTDYKPKVHNLAKLYRYTKGFSKELAMVFPRSNDTERHLFEQLKKGYVEARYDPDFTISKEELTTIIERVRQLQSVTEQICKAHIAALG